MTEKDLLRYCELSRKERDLARRYCEEEERLSSIPGPRGPSSVGGGNGDGTDNLVQIIDRRKKILSDIEAVKRELILAENTLDKAEAALESEPERRVFSCIYRDDMNIRQCAKYTHYSLSNVYKIRNAILTAVAPLST